jgi:DNA-directed RNA polymerase subunit RPC12/RpoP
MTYRKRYRCRNCGTEFEAELLTEEEVRELNRQGKRGGKVHCSNPKCNRTDVDPI